MSRRSPSENTIRVADPNQPQRLKAAAGIICMLLACVFFVVSDATGQNLKAAQFSTAQILMVRALTGVLLAGTLAWYFGAIKASISGKMTMHVFRGFAWTSSTILYIIALADLKLTQVYIFAALAPFWAILFSKIFYRGDVKFVLLPSMIVMLLGVYVSSDAVVLSWSLAAATLAGFSLGIVFAVTDKLKKGSDPFTMLFSTSVVATICAATILSIYANFYPHPVWRSPTNWNEFGILAVNGISGATANLLVIFSLRFSNSQIAGPFEYALIVFGAAGDLLLTGLMPATPILWGATLIVIGGILLAISNELEDQSVINKIRKWKKQIY